MQSMKTPRTREEFERNLQLLGRSITDGKFHVPRDMILDHLMRIRYLPNGRIDFLSVDESARLQANMSAQFDNEEFQKAFSEIKPPEDQTQNGDDSEANRQPE
jgi:hypothetical protein